MRAIEIKASGGPEQLRIEEVPDPTPGPDEVLVDVAAAGLNFIDTYHRSGLYPMDFPFVPGLEGVGTIAALGSEVDGLVVGERVGWTGALGSYAERHVVPAADAIPIPDGIDTEVAAAVLLQGLTAHYLATDTFPLGPGTRCLIHAGAGGVGLLLTQIAAMKGAQVLTTVGTDQKAEASRAAGADEVIVYTRVDFKTAVEEVVGVKALDVVYDGVGKATFHDSIDLLRPRGMMVTFGNASGPVPEISPLMLMRKGSLFLTRPTIGDYLQSRDELIGRATDLFTWIAEGSVEVTIGGRYPLEQAADAHRALEARETIGKVLIVP